MKQMIQSCVIAVLLVIPSLSSAQNPDSLFKVIENRFNSYAKHDTLEMRVLSSQMECDKHWQVKKEVRVDKKLITSKAYSDVQIYSAKEIKGEKEKDLTEKYRKEAVKDSIKRKKAQEDTTASKEKKKSFSLRLTELLPDSAKRPHYTFALLEDTLINHREAIGILAKTDVEEESYFEGKYFFDKEFGDVLYIDVSPAKNPKFVKSMRMQLQFEVLPGNFFAFRHMRMQVHAGIFIKSKRLIVEENYSDFRFVEKRVE